VKVGGACDHPGVMSARGEQTADHTEDQVAAGLLRDLLRLSGLTVEDLAAVAGLPVAEVAGYVAGDSQPTLGGLIRIVESIGYELRGFYVALPEPGSPG
jgi:transcriptional regulator with XRE-family HTH domain